MYFHPEYSDVARMQENLPEPSFSFFRLSSYCCTISPGGPPAFHLFVLLPLPRRLPSTTWSSRHFSRRVTFCQSYREHVARPIAFVVVAALLLSSWKTKSRVTRVRLHGAVSDRGSLETRSFWGNWRTFTFLFSLHRGNLLLL